MASFQIFKPTLLHIEGTYQNYPSDKGNKNSLGILVGTNYGISARFYESVINRPPTVSDMKNLTASEALQLHKTFFWDRLNADRIIDQAIAELLVDAAINTGVITTIKMLQRTLNRYFGKTLKVDGVMGSNTMFAVNTANNNELFNKISQARSNYYNSLSMSIFSSSWLDRIKEIAQKFNKQIMLNQDNTLIVGISLFALAWYLVAKQFKEAA